jgi:hypothetical protein
VGVPSLLWHIVSRKVVFIDVSSWMLGTGTANEWPTDISKVLVVETKAVRPRHVQPISEPSAKRHGI